jgi:hypothetical protein
MVFLPVAFWVLLFRLNPKAGPASGNLAVHVDRSRRSIDQQTTHLRQQPFLAGRLFRRGRPNKKNTLPDDVIAFQPRRRALFSPRCSVRFGGMGDAAAKHMDSSRSDCQQRLVQFQVRTGCIHRSSDDTRGDMTGCHNREAFLIGTCGCRSSSYSHCLLPRLPGGAGVQEDVVIADFVSLPLLLLRLARAYTLHGARHGAICNV